MNSMNHGSYRCRRPHERQPRSDNFPESHRDGASDLDQLVCDGKTLRGSIEPTAGGGSAFIAQVTLHSAALGVANCYVEARRLQPGL